MNSSAFFSLSPLDVLLSSGGDARILCDKSGRNKYGCFLTPRSDILSYGSSTASTISERSYAAAVGLYQKLRKASEHEAPHVTYAREMDLIREELIRLCDLTSLRGLDIVFASSGTDLHLLIAQLMCRAASSLRVIMAEASETGSGVPAAVTGHHFSNYTSGGASVAVGEPIADLKDIEIAFVKGRSENGDLRPSSVIDNETERLVIEAIAAGHHVLINLIDVSKTGFLAPSPACAFALKRRFASKVDIVVDACQFRLANSTIRTYLEQECLIAITGSKFITGPAFSSALIIPQQTAEYLRNKTLPSELRPYSVSADWPSTWKLRSTFEQKANYGLLLRWEAALAELRAFHNLPEKDIRGFLEIFADAIQKRLREDPVFEPIAPGVLKRWPAEPPIWDHIPTIFSFLMRHQEPKSSLMDGNEISRIYELMREDLSLHSSVLAPESALAATRCQLGQPVICGASDRPIYALRLCLDVRHIVAALSPEGCGSQEVIRNALRVLDKAAMLAGRSWAEA